MRAFAVLFSAAFLAGCPAAPTDPDLAKPCGQRRAPSLTVGTGASDYEDVPPQGVLVEEGPQGGYHIWMGLSCRGLGPQINLVYGIKEADATLDVSGTLEQVVELAYDPASDTDRTAGIRGFFMVQPDQVIGHHVTLWAEVTDACVGDPIKNEVTTLVTGYDR